MHSEDLAVIILAAGKGTRFGESYTKLLYPIFDKPLIYYPIQNLKNLNVDNIFVVVSDPKVEDEVKKYISCNFVYMDEPTGTADAVKAALPKLPANIKTLMVLNGDDATLYSKKNLEDFINSHITQKSPISLMTLITRRDMQVGRIIRDKNQNFSKILEYKEYSQEGIKSHEINCGVYLIDLIFAKTNLPNIPKSLNGEYYLTDLLNIAKEKHDKINLYTLKDHSQWIGINDKKDLRYAESIIKKRNLLNQVAQTVHFLGIAGSGTSACAKLAESTGFKVTGCDKDLSGEFTQTLGKIKTYEGHNPNHLEEIDILAVTPAVLSLDPDNPELLKAKELGIKIMTWQGFCGTYLTKNKFVIAVAGTHGKSTTTAMVGKILEDSGLDPTVLLGASTTFWNANYRIPISSLRLPEGGRVGSQNRDNLDKKQYFVIEADEFNDNYMSLIPDITILTNIEFDHPEFFKDYQSYEQSFKNFLAKTKNVIIANLSDENSKKALEEKGPDREAGGRLRKVSGGEFSDKGKSGKIFFPPIIDYSKNLINFPLKVTGEHNRLNASAAFNLGLNLEISPEKLRESLKFFPGIGRRMELIGVINGAKIFSDFAHHPTAIKVATNQIKKTYPNKKIHIIYQPHMFSRTKALFKEFVEVFKNLNVEEVAMLNIYPSREKDTGLVKTQDLVEAIKKDNVKSTKSVKQIWNKIKPTLSSQDVVIFMGAGDIDSEIGKQLSS